MNKVRLPSRGLYAITDSALHAGDALAQAVTRAIHGGAKVIQYRDKSGDPERRGAEAVLLRQLCRGHGIPLIINDDVELAGRIGADGVHLGRDDMNPSEARARLGDGFIIGVSCYNKLALAEAAERDGADYVAFGSMFSSSTKPGATRAGIDTVVSARKRVHLPIVAIGGITAENGASLLDAGVDLLAVVRGVFGHHDPAVPARQLARLFCLQTREEEL